VANDAAAYHALDSEADAFAALIVDINLGRGTTGFDVARYARRLNPSLPVIYVTGGLPRSVAVYGVPGGALVPKPFDRNLLLDTLREKLVANAQRG